MTTKEKDALQVAETTGFEGLLPGLQRNSEGNHEVYTGSLALLKEIIGTETEAAAGAIFDNLLMSGTSREKLNGDKILTFMQELQPQNGLEAMLIAHMTTVHFAMSYSAMKFYYAESPKLAEGYERSMTRLNRTFLSQVETLRKMRGQTTPANISVDNVNVNEGGQAIVGNVKNSRK